MDEPPATREKFKVDVSEPEGKRQQYETNDLNRRKCLELNFVKKTVWLEELNPVLKTVLSRKNYIYPEKSTISKSEQRYSANG